MAATAVTDENFETEVLKSDKPVVVDFWAEWCGPCKMMSPIVDELAQEMEQDVKIVKLNIEHAPEAPSKYGVRGIPTFIVFKDGEAIAARSAGMPKDQLSEWIKEQI